MDETAHPHLSRSLGPLSLWGLGVGYVISGMYFGWNLGLPQGGTLGFAIALCFIAIMFVAFTFSYCELACAIPKAGGAFDYASLALGRYWGFLAGMAQIIEFVFAPPAIASAIGAYLGIFFPHINPIWIAIIAYCIFTSLNIYGIKAAAFFELIITIIAVLGILIFVSVTLPHFHFQHFTLNPLPHGITGIFLALPFAIWFFLGIEGIANLSEETINPQKNIFLGFGSAMFTLIILSTLTFISAVGVGGWEKVSMIGTTTSDSPLPLALNQVINQNNILYHLLVSIGLIGLVASFHGIILAAGRVSLELGRIGYAPKFLGNIHPTFKTPANALCINMLVGILALLTGKTSEIITVACFGALSIYIISIISLLKLRKTQPNMIRPFRVPFYPYAPITALIIAFCSLMVMITFNFKYALIYFGILLCSLLWFKLFFLHKQPAEELTLEAAQS